MKNLPDYDKFAGLDETVNISQFSRAAYERMDGGVLRQADKDFLSAVDTVAVDMSGPDGEWSVHDVESFLCMKVRNRLEELRLAHKVMDR